MKCNGITVSLWFVAMMYISTQEYAFHEERVYRLSCATMFRAAVKGVPISNQIEFPAGRASLGRLYTLQFRSWFT